MERQIMLHRPWTCQWGKFGHVVGPVRETTPTVFWSCTHPALPDSPQRLGSGACTACPRWTAASRLTAPRGDRREDDHRHLQRATCTPEW